MLLKEMINKYPEQYIAVAYVKKGVDNLIQTATVLKVYPTLQDAYTNMKEIKLFMNRYIDFDIVYGDYEDYVSTRRKMNVVPDKERLTQEEIDNLIALLELSENDCLLPTQLDISK